MNNLREYRLKADLSQGALAAKTGLAQPTISDLELEEDLTPVRISRYRTLVKLAGALGVRPEDLYSGGRVVA